jgi:hypothetical protein
MKGPPVQIAAKPTVTRDVAANLRKDGAGRFNAFSAGSQPKPRVNPFAFKVLESLDYPTVGLRSKSWEEFAAPGEADRRPGHEKFAGARGARTGGAERRRLSSARYDHHAGFRDFNGDVGASADDTAIEGTRARGGREPRRARGTFPGDGPIDWQSGRAARKRMITSFIIRYLARSAGAGQ